MTQQTLPHLLLKKAKADGKKIAFRQKDLGIWNEWAWEDYFEAVQTFAIGLQERFGVQKKDAVGIIGDNRPQWVISELALQSIGAIPVGIYQDATPEQFIHYIKSSKVRLLIVEDQEQVDKVLEIMEAIPQIEGIIYYNEKGLRSYTHPKLHYFNEIQDKGKVKLKEMPTMLENQLIQIEPADIALIAFTSGSTNDSKPAMFTHENIIQTAISIHKVDDVQESEDYLSFLSLAWICEQVFAVGMSLTRGLTINFPEEPSTILNDLREIGPHIIQAPPRTYENIMARFDVRINDTTNFKKKVYSWCESLIGMKAGIKLSNQSVSTISKISYYFADFLLFSAIRDHLGLSRVKRAYVTGASLNTEGFEFFQGLGVNVKQTYGTVETTGYATIQSDDKVNTRTVGESIPDTLLHLTPEGEIQVEGKNVFAGYVDGEKADILQTGDHGEFDESGELCVIDRFDDLITLESGEHISTGEIESHLRSSPYIQEAVVFGRELPTITAMINISQVSVGRWADKNQITYKNFKDLSTNPEVAQLINGEMERIVKMLPEENQVKRFVILPKELDVEKGELTPTQKVVRNKVEENYELYLAALYRDDMSEHSYEQFKTEDLNDITVHIISLEIAQGVA